MLQASYYNKHPEMGEVNLIKTQGIKALVFELKFLLSPF